MIILGLYSTAISISQDIRLRQFIKNMTKKDLGFLSNIGQHSDGEADPNKNFRLRECCEGTESGIGEEIRY